MKLVIRADASPKIGAGHIMRCIALGQAWQERDGEVTFVCASVLDSIAERICGQGFQLISTESKIGSAHDAKDLQTIARRERAEAIVTDGYDFNVDFYKSLQQSALPTMAIDDHGHLTQYLMQFVLNQNLGATKELYPNVGSGTELLLGTKYTLLRREFRSPADRLAALKSKMRRDRSRNTNAMHVLVTLGAADPGRALDVVIDGLLELSDPNLKFRVITGSLNEHHNEAVARVKHDSRFEVVQHVERMSEAYRWANLAICAGGSTNWEMCCFGIPRVVIVLSENQRRIAEELERCRIAINLGDSTDLAPVRVSEAVERLLGSSQLRESAITGSKKIVDGRGAERVIQRLMAEQSFHFRHAQLEDWKILLAWRNDPTTRAASRNTEIISEQEHRNWLSQILSDDRNTLLIAESNERPVGTVRIDRHANAEISWSVVPKERGKGIGGRMVRAIVENIDYPILAIIRRGNEGSRRIAESAGFRMISAENDWIKFLRTPGDGDE